MEMKSNIEANFNDQFKKIDEKETTEGLVYGATTKREEAARTHHKVKRIVKYSLIKEQVKLPMEISSTKLGEILHTKRRYLRKLRKN